MYVGNGVRGGGAKETRRRIIMDSNSRMIYRHRNRETYIYIYVCVYMYITPLTPGDPHEWIQT